mmetsp:Transcript_24785/g.83310  ORF Transcript_24785/g.83310 Transcript_24785/m.83310 type:complete len:214 (+) Transcript_24785:135-776(+)
MEPKLRGPPPPVAPLYRSHRFATRSSSSKYVGNVLAVHPGSRMLTATPAQAASANVMAMRWSSYVSMSTSAFGRPAGGVITQCSSNSTTSAPSLVVSATMAFMRSVSLTRHEATPRIVVGPSATSATAASVMAASGMSTQSTSMPRRRAPSGRETVMFVGCQTTVAPICSSTLAKRTSPCVDAEPQPTTVHGPPVMAAAAMKYDADDASPSTK